MILKYRLGIPTIYIFLIKEKYLPNQLMKKTTYYYPTVRINPPTPPSELETEQKSS